MLKAFKAHIDNNFQHLREVPILLAVSGGVDSVVLAHLFAKSDMNFAIAHCNFQLRAADSDKDEDTVAALAKKLNSEYHVTRFDTTAYIDKNKVSVQVGARELRYHWFAQIMQEYDYRTLVTGHHADDSIETFLINLSRGTGIDGLTGIPAKLDSIARPLLAFSKADILKYAQTEKLEWREDNSNSDTKYLRNKIRHELVPKLAELHPRFLENFEKTMGHLKGTTLVLKNHINALKKELFIVKDDVVHISIAKLQGLNPVDAYLFELFKEYGFSAWSDVKGLLTASSGKMVLSKTHRLLKDRDRLMLQKLELPDSGSYLISKETQVLEHPLKLEVKEVDNYEKANNQNILYIDKKTLKYPLELRKWRKGDYFYPIGMKGKKKVSKFFKDEKMDLISKERQWLLYSDQNLVWVVGRRADDRFKVTQATKTILKIKLN